MSLTKEINIPSAYSNFSDDFLLDSRDVMQIFGFNCSATLSSAVKRGDVPKPISKQKVGMSGGQKNLYRLGDLRELKKQQESES